MSFHHTGHHHRRYSLAALLPQAFCVLTAMVILVSGHKLLWLAGLLGVGLWAGQQGR
jgi:hypothetical protein